MSKFINGIRGETTESLKKMLDILNLDQQNIEMLRHRFVGSKKMNISPRSIKIARARVLTVLRERDAI